MVALILIKTTIEQCKMQFDPTRPSLNGCVRENLFAMLNGGF